MKREDFVLTRALIEAGGIDALVAKADPTIVLLTEAERQASLHATLAARPAGTAAWLFGYGSLIWNPTVEVMERRVACIDGWHRAFCLSTAAGRGTASNPGLVLGLDAGGHCTGIALRLAEETLFGELTLLWRREMLAGSYTPRWLPVSDPAGVPFGHAITFVINPAAPQYTGAIAREAVIRRLATAAGELGSAADYLFRTCDGLRAEGVPDPELEQLEDAVRVAQAVAVD